MKPPIEFTAPQFHGRPEREATWAFVWKHTDDILAACTRGDAGVSAFTRQQMEELCPTLDHMFLRMVGAMVAAVASHHGLQQVGRQQLYKKPWKTGATYGARATGTGASMTSVSKASGHQDLHEELDGLAELAALLHQRIQEVAAQLRSR